MPDTSPTDHKAEPNSTTTKRVPASSLSGETTAPPAQAGEGAVLGGLPDSSNDNKVV